MHYYQFNIGDYRKDTGHLSLLEHGIYRSLIDSYYLNEGGLLADDAKLMRTHSIRTEDAQQAYKNVINDFFREDDGYYINDKCEGVMGKIFDKSQKARESAQKRWEKKANGMRTQCDGNANGMLPINPIPTTHIPKIKNSAPSSLDYSKWPQMPSDQTLKDWLAMRKRLKANVSQTVINRLGPKFKKAAESNYSVDDCLSECVERNWKGFDVEWMESKSFSNQQKNVEYDNESTDWAVDALNGNSGIMGFDKL